MGERTGSRVFQWVWSYVPVGARTFIYIGIDDLATCRACVCGFVIGEFSIDSAF
ncbi:hypothetical protein CCHR01_19810 [Colletotrichum chrysophilum]|uniref:Uncharacterized protein n=1 Tax=Colletotrichum chrysophilum TaxID=1836956 RepID=A0AAD8ZXS4_9PEZI|nr:hypothetical protein CCHR01_19810 [Colletotrichum chrysophilum]